MALRAWPRSALWLDEAQSVSFARLPITEVPAALRTDGAPPLYYIVLHCWIRVFGDGDVAVRSLSVLLSLLALGVLTVAARRIAGGRAAFATFVLVALNPFAVRYGSETRMYSLVMLEVATGLLLLHAVSRAARPVRLVGLSLVSGALLYTHYWSIYLLATLLAVLVVQGWRQRGTPMARSALVIAAAVVAGCALWLPWLANFRFQSRHTGTPWARRASFGAITDALGFRFSGAGFAVPALAAVGTLLVVAALLPALLGAVVARRHPPSRAAHTPAATSDAPADEAWTVRLSGIAVVMAGTAVVALLGGIVSHSAYAGRYTSVVFPLALLLAGAGAARMPWQRVGALMTAFAAALGIVLSLREVHTDRTRAADLVRTLEHARRADSMGDSGGDFGNDIIVYCPDQLGPATSRLIDRDTSRPMQVSYLPESSPERVDWVDYQDRYDAADAASFANALERRVPLGTIWLVVSLTYPPTQGACTDLLAALRSARPDNEMLVADDPTIVDHGALWRFEPNGSSPPVS